MIEKAMAMPYWEYGGDYRGRDVIERMFGRLKNFLRIATRYDKNAEDFLAGLCLVTLICYRI